jgi:hypothetical protein
MPSADTWLVPFPSQNGNRSTYFSDIPCYLTPLFGKVTKWRLPSMYGCLTPSPNSIGVRGASD